MSSKRIRIISNVVITIIFIFSIIMLFKYSSLPNIFNIDIMAKPKETSNIQLSIYTSLLASGIFYFIIEFIPSAIQDKEEEEKRLPYRCAANRNVQLFTVRCISFWTRILNCSAKIYPNHLITETSEINLIFREESIKALTKVLKLNSASDLMLSNGQYLQWYNRIINDLSEIKKSGDEILHYQKDEISSELYDAIFYLVNSSPIFIYLPTVMSILYESNRDVVTLGDCLVDNLDLSETRKHINTLFNWVNAEYESLARRKLTNIYRITVEKAATLK